MGRSTAATQARVPLVSVIVATYRGERRIPVCLGSLLRQSLAPSDYEIVVVQNGPTCGTSDYVRALQTQHPDHAIRLIETPEAGAANARNIGIDAARAPFITIVDDDDWVSERFLAVLLAAAAPDVVPTAPLSDIAPGSTPGSTDGDLDNYINRRLQPHAGSSVAADDVPASLSLHAGKLLPTDLAREVRYSTGLRSGEDFVFLAGLHARAPFDVRVLGPDSGAVYYRALREESLSRRALTYDFAVTERLDCIDALGDLMHTRSGPHKVTDALARAQATFLVRYLEENPDERDRVVADVHRRGIDSPTFWATLNKGQARDLALLYLFAPFQDTSALVAARRLRARGLVTDVINQNVHNIRERDDTSLKIAVEQVGRHRILPGSGAFSSWGNARTYAEESVAAADELAERNGAPYRSVYTRAMAPHSHIAGALMKLRHPEIRWTAEFSDPMHHNAYGETRTAKIADDELRREFTDAVVQAGFDKPDSDRFFEWTEIVSYALADEIVFTNENQREFMLEYADPHLGERARSLSVVSHHPTLPQRFYEMAEVTPAFRPGTVNIGYFGAFYLTRGLTEVIAALRDLHAGERRRVQLHIHTADPATLRLEALKAGLADVIVARPYLPFLQFLAATRHFDALLVNDTATAEHHSINPYLPSKLSDYLGSGSPIWAIVEPGSVLSTIDTDYRSTLGDPVGALRVIRSIIAAGPRA